MTKKPVPKPSQTTISAPPATPSPAITLQIGDIVPDFALAIADDAIVTPHSYAGQILALYFYPKDDTPVCTQQALDFSGQLEAFTAAGVAVLGVSRDPLKAHAKFTKKHNLLHRLGSDPEGRMAELFGVWVEKQMYGRRYMSMERSTFLIDRNGRIAQVWRKVNVEGHVADVLAQAKRLAAEH